LIIYSNSCSFGAPNQKHKVYADHVAEQLRGALVNDGQPNSCNRRIIRTSLRELDKIKNEENIIVLLGLSFVSRTELWQLDLPANDNDGHFNPITIDYEQINWKDHGLINTIVPNIHTYARLTVKDYYKNWLLHYHPESEVTNLLTDLIMFTGWCRSYNIKYLIFSNVDVLPDENQVGYTSPFISSLHKTINEDKNILDLWRFSFKDYAFSHNLKPMDYELYGEHGHPSEEAHTLFGNFLYNLIKTHDTN
jgi:hypothetical protein